MSKNKIIDLINNVNIPIFYTETDILINLPSVSLKSLVADGFYNPPLRSTKELIFVNEKKVGHNLAYFYWVMLHELIHATGWSLGRFKDVSRLTPEERYGEELLACFCADKLLEIMGLRLTDNENFQINAHVRFYKTFAYLNNDNAKKAIDFFLNNGLSLKNDNKQKVG